MKVPSEEFWFRVGLCTAAITRLKEIRDLENYSDEVLEEEKTLTDFLYEQITDISATVYEED